MALDSAQTQVTLNLRFSDPQDDVLEPRSLTVPTTHGDGYAPESFPEIKTPGNAISSHMIQNSMKKRLMPPANSHLHSPDSRGRTSLVDVWTVRAIFALD